MINLIINLINNNLLNCKNNKQNMINYIIMNLINNNLMLILINNLNKKNRKYKITNMNKNVIM